MSSRFFVLLCLGLTTIFLAAWTAGPANDGRVLGNPGEAKWEASKSGSESVTLREDAKSGGLELFARYPAGHVFAPHWHTANERLVLIEGRISLQEGGHKRLLEPGGYAYLPARQVQRMACVSDTRCSFYVFWDGPLDLHPPED